MSDSSATVRSLITYGIVLPLAVVLGCMLVSLPEWDRSAMVVIGIVLSVLCLPLFLRWYHQLLVLSWNATALVFFLPGRPELWLFLSLAAFIAVVVQRTLNSEVRLSPVPFMLWPVLFLLIVIVGTAVLNGGIHLGTLGGKSLGGRKYLYMISAVLGFIVITSVRVPENKARFYLGAFFLGALTNLAGNLVHFAGPWLSFILWVFPVFSGSSYLYEEDLTMPQTGISRDYGLTVACSGVLFYMLAKYGIRDLLRGGPLKIIIALFFFVASMMGGFRGNLALLLMTCFFLFWVEGLFRSKFVLLPIVVLLLALPLAPLVSKLHPSIQRSLSVLPLAVSPDVRDNAEGSKTWRLDMWKNLMPQIPQYLWIGKGFESDTAEFVSTVIRQRLGGSGSDAQAMSGDYHNGPLSVIIPLGIWGVIGWIWFWAAGFRVLYLNHCHGPGYLKTVNAFLLALFLARIVLFLFVFGSSYSDLGIFAGLFGLSICLNGGVARPLKEPTPAGPARPAAKLKTPVRFVPGLQR